MPGRMYPGRGDLPVALKFMEEFTDYWSSYGYPGNDGECQARKSYN